MRSKNTNLDRLISNILNEEIDSKSKKITEKHFGEWVEVETKESLKGKQHKIDVAEPKGKITSDDFKKLRASKGNLGKKSTKNVKEQETEEGSAWGKAVSDAKKEGKKSFDFKGKDYKVTNENRNLMLKEDELIDLIQTIAEAEMVKDRDEKTNISIKSPEGLKKTNKALDASKKENDDYIKQVTQKMKDYLKDGSKGEYSESPNYFPKNNGQLGEMPKKAYKASKAVEEYIENFAYAAGLDELAYDEIEPNEEWVKDNIVGSSRTGNNPKWANAVETDLGERIHKKSQVKPYTTEKRKGSYKRQSQPIDKAGEHEGKSSIDDMFAKLESTVNKKEKLVSEDMDKMKNLITYNRKTQ